MNLASLKNDAKTVVDKIHALESEGKVAKERVLEAKPHLIKGTEELEIAFKILTGTNEGITNV